MITEYEPEQEAKSANFPIRNRIISGLSNRSVGCRSRK